LNFTYSYCSYVIIKKVNSVSCSRFVVSAPNFYNEAWKKKILNKNFMLKKRFYIVRKNNFFFVYVDSKIFFVQKILKSNVLFLTNETYTYFYVLKICARFGLILNLKKKKFYV
jgi:hypothetical protein